MCKIQDVHNIREDLYQDTEGAEKFGVWEIIPLHLGEKATKSEGEPHSPPASPQLFLSLLQTHPLTQRSNSPIPAGFWQSCLQGSNFLTQLSFAALFLAFPKTVLLNCRQTFMYEHMYRSLYIYLCKYIYI